MTQNKEFDFNFVDIISLLWKYRKSLLIIGISTAVLTAIFTAPIFIKPKYAAEVVFYPTTINSIGNAMFTDLTQRQQDPLAFGEEEESENTLQLLNSSTLQQKIIENFDLLNHYDIDKDGGRPFTDLARKMKSNIKFNRTRHLAVAINVLDHDPIKAAEIANGIAAIYDTVKTEIQKQVSLEALQIVEEQYKNKEKEVWELRQRLQELGKKGITNYEEQSRAIAEELYKSNSGSKRKELQAQQEELAKYAGEFTYLNETLILELESLSKLRKRFEKSKVDVEKTLPQKFILTSAAPAEEKSYPVRSMLVLLITAAVGFFSIVVLLIMNQLNLLRE